MNKKSILATVLLSALILGSTVTTQADELVIGESPVTVVSEIPSEVVIGGETGITETPVGDQVSSTPNSETVIGDSGATKPLDKDKTESIVEEATDTPQEKPEPNDSQMLGSDNKDKSDDKSAASLDDKADKPQSEAVSEKPKEENTEENGKPEVSEAVKVAEDNTGASSTGEAKSITMPEVTVPLVTNTGYKVVATKDSQVIVETPQGTVEVKPAEAIGAVRQKDGTVAIKTKEGKLEVLPKTGDEETYQVILGVFLFAAGAFLYLKKDRLKNWLKGFKK